MGDDCQKVPWQNLDGLIKVTVLPPRGLDFPVLPIRMHSKLMFVLCYACAEKLSPYYCDHNQALRALTGTWVIDEVKLAVSKGYEIIKVHEIWEYKVSQYDPVTRTGGVFAPYIDSFLKLKAEASGYPASCETEEQKQAYINEFSVREDANKIDYNPGLRQLAKIQLYSFWGRFGMRPDLMRTVLIKSYGELVNKMFDHTIEINVVIPINDDNMLVIFREIEEIRTPDKTTNVVIAAFTTAYARMELYKYLDMLGTERVYYYDTDSLLISQSPGEVFSPTTNETTTVVKVKGIILNYENSQKINFDLMKNMIIGPSPNTDEKPIDSVQVENNCIRRTRLGDVYTTRVPKTYRCNYVKRQKTDIDYRTVPYGY